MNAYCDYTIDWSQWGSNANWCATSWAQSPWLAGVTPVIGIPMALSADAGNQDQDFKKIASGQLDSAFNAVFAAWKQAGYTNFYIRPGWEMNGSWMPWSVGTDPTTQADFVAAFQHIASLAHSYQGATIKVVWNPNEEVSWGGTSATSLYPGDSSVDVIGLDTYSPAYPADLYNWGKNDGSYAANATAWAADPANLTHYYEYPGATKDNPTGAGTGQFGTLQAQAFALAHGKPFALPETGSGTASGGTGDGPADNPTFVQFLQSALTAPNAPTTAFATIWDVNDGGNYAFSGIGNLPQEAAAWRAFAAATVGGTTTTTSSSTDTLTLRMSEDAWNGDAQFTVSVDGKQVGGTLTASALHSTADSNVFLLTGQWGSGTHTVQVKFLNDAYGGSSTTDRNLYVDSIGYDGTTYGKTSAALRSAGTSSLTVGGTTATASAPADTLTLHLAETAWNGDAKFTLTIDGKQITTAQSVTTLLSSGKWQDFTFSGNFGAGSHTVGVAFVNDAYGGSSATDRNLYVGGIDCNGQHYGSGTSALMSNGTASYTISTAH